MSKKKKSAWEEVPDIPIPACPNILCDNMDAIIEFTFVVNDKFKEVFRRAMDAVENNRSCLFFEKDKILTNLIYNINFDTMKINKRGLSSDEIYKPLKKVIKSRLKGKKTGEANIYEKDSTDAFCFRTDDDNFSHNIRSFYTLVARINYIRVDTIYERAEEIYCVCSFKPLPGDCEYSVAGKFLGTFADLDKGLDTVVKHYCFDVENREMKLVNSEIVDNKLSLDLSEYTDSYNINNEHYEVELIDVSTVWRVNARIGVNKDLHETVRAITELEEILQCERNMDLEDRIRFETSLLMEETNIAKAFIQKHLMFSRYIGDLRGYQEERMISKMNNEALKELFEEERACNKNFRCYSFAHMLSKFTKVSTAGFNINEQEDTIEWVLDAEICGYGLEQLNDNFKVLLKNSKTSMIEFTVKEEEAE